MWLNPDDKGEEALQKLLRPYPKEERMVVDKVSKDVNSPRNDHPGCVEPID